MRFLLLICAILLAGPALASEGPAVATAHATATLVGDTDAAQPGQIAHIGLHLVLAPGWHVYGADPGDAGLPPTVDLHLTGATVTGGIDWPPTEDFHEGGLTTHGYRDAVVLAVPVRITAPPVQARAVAGWLICNRICVPEQATLTLDVPAGPASTGPQAALFHPAAPPAQIRHGVWHLALLAWAGGLLLNLMPCVFPILAMKGLAFARLAGGARRTVRWQALGYSLGVVCSFAMLGAGLLGLRAAGQGAGWGFQLQHPLIVMGLGWLMLAIGLNLSGVYGVGLGRAAGWGGRLAGAGGWGSIGTGVLAVLVATPCTAPFMGVAIAAALAGPAWSAMTIFLALGAGLATPTLILAIWPAMAAALPRPGLWMERTRQALAFPLYAAAAWLVWVAGQQGGSVAVAQVLAGGVLLGFGLWAIGAAQTARGRRGRRIGAALAVLAGGALLVVSPWGGGTPSQPSVPFSVARLAALRAEHYPVLVDITAAWCVTCLVNEAVAIDTVAVRAAMTRHGVVYLRGDWTRQDPAISAYLHAQGRDGVPLYVYYPADGPARLLPQILTQGIVLAAIDGRP